jgi:hypothetical protein
MLKKLERGIWKKQFKSSCGWRQDLPLKHWNRRNSLHYVTTPPPPQKRALFQQPPPGKLENTLKRIMGRKTEKLGEINDKDDDNNYDQRRD